MANRTSYILAGAAVIGVTAWFIVNTNGAERDVYADTNPTAEAAVQLPTVVVRNVSSQLHPLTLDTYGRTEANRVVDVKAQTAAQIVSTPIREGTRVTRGTVICRQDIDARQAVVDQARASLAKAETDLAATARLVEAGFKSAAQLPADEATRDAARAQLRQAEEELDNVVMRAPFTGIFDRQIAEVGDYLAPGQPCGRVVELDPLVVEAELSETQVGAVAAGDPVAITLASGEAVEGTIRFVESEANAATRTFRVEAEVPNPDLRLRAGVSATATFRLGTVEASRIPAGVLTLSDTGETGVRYLSPDDVVNFAAVDVLDEDEDGVWVRGLPSPARIIIEGQDFVAEGARVDARLESGAVSSRTSPVAGVPPVVDGN